MIDDAIREDVTYGYLVIGLIVIFAPLIAERLRLPGLLGLLIAGALIGPNMFGVLNDFTGVENFGSIGILYLIYLAGLQLDIQTFRRYWEISGAFGLITSIIPFALGTLFMLRLDFDVRAAILIGSFWASFTLIAYPVLKQFELTRTRSGAALLGASAITDTVSLLVLALVAGSVTGDQSGLVLLLDIALGLAILGVWCLIILPVIARWFFSTLGRGRILRFMLIFVGLMSAAVVAQIVDVEPLLGAFFAGLGLNRLVPNESALMERTEFVGNALFIPVFMVSVGLLFDPAVMFTASTIELAFWLSAALVIGKLTAAWISGMLFDLSRAEIGVLFSVSVAQAAATLAATIIGLELGLYGDDVVNAVMIVIAVSLFITSLGTPIFAAQVERPAEDERRIGEVVLVPTRTAGTGLAGRLRLAGRIADASGGVIIPTVISVPLQDHDISEARSHLAEIDDTLFSLGLEGDSRIRVDVSVAQGISRAALENNASLVLLDWPDPRPIVEYFAERTSDEVARLVSCPIAFASLVDEPIERVVLAVAGHDLQPSRTDDLRAAAAIATAFASNRQLIVGPVTPETLEEAGIVLPESVHFQAGPPDPEQWARENATPGDLVVLVSHGQRFGSLVGEPPVPGRSVVAVTTSKARRWAQDDPAAVMSGGLGATPRYG